jgi:hypothetical protein
MGCGIGNEIMAKKKKVHPWDFYQLTDEQRNHALTLIMDSKYTNKALQNNDPFICYIFDNKLQRKLNLWLDNNCNILITKLKDTEL